MYEIKITVEIPGLPEALTALAGALKAHPMEGFTQDQQTDSSTVKEAATTAPVNPTVTAPIPVTQTNAGATMTPTTPANAGPVTAVQTGPATTSSPSEAKSYTVDDISRAGAALIDQGKMPQLIELLKKYGVQAVTQLNANVYPAFVEEMKALGAQL